VLLRNKGYKKYYFTIVGARTFCVKVRLH